MSKLTDTYEAFLVALRPLVADTPALAALDDYLAARADRTGPKPRKRDDHEWRPMKGTLATRAGAPKRALTTLSKPDCAFRKCAKCGIVSNSKYPFWFRDRGTWQMAKPPCADTAGANEARRVQLCLEHGIDPYGGRDKLDASEEVEVAPLL